MCRHLGYLGAPVSVAALMLDPPHGLLHQSYVPRRQTHGLLNADGWGVGFLDGTEIRRWRSATPLWGDASFASIAPALHSDCVVAAVRSASPGMPIEASATSPFTDGRWLLSHNGVVDRKVLPHTDRAESICDSALLAAVVFTRGLDNLGATVVEIGAADPTARLNILAGDGTRLLATTWGETLSVLNLDTAVVLASEPYDDDPRWRDITDRHLVEVNAHGIHLMPLERR